MSSLIGKKETSHIARGVDSERYGDTSVEGYTLTLLRDKYDGAIVEWSRWHHTGMHVVGGGSAIFE